MHGLNRSSKALLGDALQDGLGRYPSVRVPVSHHSGLLRQLMAREAAY